MVPILIPITRSEPKCPGCKLPENKKEICANCGHVYKEDYSLFIVFGWIMVLGAIVGPFLLKAEGFGAIVIAAILGAIGSVMATVVFFLLIFLVIVTFELIVKK